MPGHPGMLDAAPTWPELLLDGSEMGERIYEYDWSTTSLGSIDGWSQSLRAMASMAAGNSFPMSVLWGPNLVQIYNDAYVPILGSKHPNALGQPAAKTWPEVWHIIEPQFEQVLHQGKGMRIEDQPFVFYRHGYFEEVYSSCAYSPLRGEDGEVDGILVTSVETTGRVLSERRLHTLTSLGACAAEARTPEGACTSAAEVLAKNPHDIPFALIYLLDDDAKRARLAATAGLDAGGPASPKILDLGSTEEAGSWPLTNGSRTEPQLVNNLETRFGALPGGPWPESPHTALVLPITSPTEARPTGFLMAGTSPCLPLDDAYREFLALAAAQVATAVTNARAHEEEHKRAEALAELDRAKTDFFSSVSHEFRTPLTLLLAPLEEILAGASGPLSPAQKQGLELVYRNGLRLLDLVNSLLALSRLEAEHTEPVYEPVDLAACTAELSGLFRSAMERAGLRLLVDCPPLPEPIYVDRGMWEKIVCNLLSNAYKFTFEGEIRVTLRPAEEHVVLTVRDTGAGIPAEELPHIFERFHRVRAAETRTTEGSGIGLALVQELAHLHSGSVHVESRVGEGTTFTVSVPTGTAHLPAGHIEATRTQESTALGAAPYVDEAQRLLPSSVQPADKQTLDRAGTAVRNADEDTDEDANGETVEHLASAPGSDRPMRILLADDNADMRAYLDRLLSQHYTVNAVADGAAALSAARTRLPDLVLADVMMPKLDGFGLLAKLRADPRLRELPVILLSARAGEASRVEGLESGADDYLIKPFSARELLARVAAHLKLKRMRAETSAEVRKARNLFDELFHAGPVAAAITRLADGKIIEVNEQLVRFTGYRREELMGRSTVDLGLWGEPAQRDELAAKMLDRGGLRNVELDVRIGSGEVRAVLASAKVIELDGEPCSLTLFIDITERKQAEKQVRTLSKALTLAEQRERRHLSQVLHDDLQQMLFSVEMQAKLLNDDIPAEQTVLRKGLGSLRMLLKDAIRTTRALSIELNPPVLRSEGFTEALGWLAGHMEEMYDLKVDLDVQKNITVRGEDQRVFLVQLVRELLFNVAKHAGVQRARVTARLEEGRLLVSVEDKGKGFDVQAAVETQIHQDTLGLFSIRERLRLFGGHLHIDSVPDKGTSVMIHLPLPHGHAPEDSPYTYHQT